MKKFLQRLFRTPLTWLANRLASAPKKDAIFLSLNKLLQNIQTEHKDATIIPFDIETSRFIIFSDHHKGVRDLADDFRMAEKNYSHALQHYYSQQFTLITLGDCEELWENTPKDVMEKNREVLLLEAQFLPQNRYYRVFGNHDLEWKYSIQQSLYLKPLFGDQLKICEAVYLHTVLNGQTYRLLLTHGHQGDQRSDGNAFSKWFVAAIWTPIQRFFEIYVDTISDHFDLVDKHNILFYEWSAAQKNLVLITGHTHKPVFASLDHFERLAQLVQHAEATHDTAAANLWKAALEKRKKEYAGKKILKTMARPSYFNSGCCCFNDGDITGIEISDGMIRLIKWEEKDAESARRVLEEAELSYVFQQLQKV